jgi:hypothetical protein
MNARASRLPSRANVINIAVTDAIKPFHPARNALLSRFCYNGCVNFVKQMLVCRLPALVFCSIKPTTPAMAKTPAKKTTAAKKAPAKKSSVSLEAVCTTALEKIKSLQLDAQLQADLEWCLGSYRHDGNPVGLVAAAQRSITLLKAEQARKTKGITAKLIGDLEKAVANS